MTGPPAGTAATVQAPKPDARVNEADRAQTVALLGEFYDSVEDPRARYHLARAQDALSATMEATPQ